MKIAYFLDDTKGLGGAGNLLLQQAVLMSEIHEVVVIVAMDENGGYCTEYVRRCEQHDLNYKRIIYRTGHNFKMVMTTDFQKIMKSTVEIEEFAKKEQIMFFHSVQLNIAVEYVARKLKIPHLMDIYQLREEEFRLCPGDIFSHNHLCDSVLYSDRWKNQLAVRSRCIRPIALLDNMKKKTAYGKEKIRILMLGDVCERKNQMTAIKAVERCLSGNEIELNIAGNAEGQYAKECKAYVKEHDLKQFIVFYGFVSDIAPLLEKCDCLLCASVDESFPSSMVEALTYDLTIISTPVAGVPEIFIDEMNSFISRDFSIKSIEKSILKCLEYHESGKIYEIHKNAEKTWRDNFERELVKKQINLYYQDILNSNVFGELQPFYEMTKLAEQMKTLLYDIELQDKEWIYERSLYYAIFIKFLSAEKVYIWGAGNFGKITFELLKKICPHMNIEAFIDTHKTGKYCGLPIIKPDYLSIDKNSLYCVSFVQGMEDAVCYLKNKGLEFNKQVWCMP